MKDSMIDLRSLVWSFDTAQPVQSELSAQAPQAEFEAPENTTRGFTIRLALDAKEFPATAEILQIPKVLDVRLRQADPGDRERQNYPAFKMPDGSVPVLEATLTLHSTEHPEWKDMTIGIPLAMLKQPAGEHEVVLNFSGIQWTMYVDGELLDNDFPFGYPEWVKKNTWKLNAKHVSGASLYTPALTPRATKTETPKSTSVQYWTPPGHNSWVGDIATLFHQGRYHVFYLYDRRHHASKFGKGAHYFEHLSTADFQTWTEHEASTPLEEQWECIGTGVPFVFDNKLCLSYGLHTTRIYPQEKTTLPVQWNYLEKNGCTQAFTQTSTPGVPAGSTYAVSRDGIAEFEKSGIMFHPCENPSVYTNPDGKLQMLANFHSDGIWESESIDAGWRCINPGFPPGGDCTFFFRWGNFDYIIGGFTGLWSKPAGEPDSAYASLVDKGLDFYDGLNVPAISEIPGGRFLMAGWIRIRGWGGNLILRELIQFRDGRIGSKWLAETMPQTETPQTLATELSTTVLFPLDDKSALLSFDVHPNKSGTGRISVSFLAGNGEQNACELQIDLAELRAQFAPAVAKGFAEREKSLREGGVPHHVGNYAIENLIGTDEPFTVRVIILGSEKLGGSLLDVEIAGQRTMISYRPDLTVKRLLFRTEGGDFGKIQITRIRRGQEDN